MLPVYASDAVRVIQSSKDVLNHWSPDQHLYVKGNIGISQSRLNDLERWLDQNGKNWTIVLMWNANRETWQDTRGVNYYGMDAVENALGRGLGNKQGFADLKDSRTKQANGAVFVLFLNERKFSYFGSDAFDHRGLGESAWAGNLDGPARNAMRSGGRIVDAVKNTVTHIEGRLSQRIAYEQRLKREAKERRERLLRMTQREIVDVRRELGELETEVGKFRAMPAVRAGDLASPPLPEWQRELDAAADALKGGHVETASSAVRSVRQKVTNHHQALQRWQHDGRKLQSLAERVEQAKLVPENPRGKVVLDSARSFYTEALNDYRGGKSSYAANMHQSITSLDALDTANRLAIRAREQREKQEREHAQKVKKMTQIGGSLGGVGLCALGFGMNRRRRKLKEYAESVREHLKDEMHGRFERLFLTMDRASIVVGSERDLPERGYEGETLNESLKAIRAVDKAFVLSSGVDDVFEKVADLMDPKWPGGKMVNFFSRSRYQDALELMERKPVQTPTGGLKVVDRREDALLGDPVKAVSSNTSLAFSELVRQFDEALGRADESLDRVETAWETIASRTEALGIQLAKIIRKEDKLRSASISDGWLAAEDLFEVWHPAARKLHERGIALGRHDPVAALDGPILQSEVMSKEMTDILTIIIEFRDTCMVPMQECTKSLRRLGRRVEWIGEAMERLGGDLDALSCQGAEKSVHEQCERFRIALYALSDRVEYAENLSNQLKNELPEIVQTTRRRVDDARSKLSRELRLNREDILTEREEWNPDVLLEEVQGLKLTVETSLDQGEVELAADALQSARNALSLADKIVEETLIAAGEFKERYAHNENLADEADSLKASGSSILDALRKKYAEAALDYEPGNAEAGNFSHAGKMMEELVCGMGEAIKLAFDAYESGRILVARNYLIEAEDSHQRVLVLQQGLEQRQSDLQKLEEQNTARMADAESSLAGMREAMSDSRICSDTIAEFSQLEAAARDTHRKVEASYGESNPYQAEIGLDELVARLSAMETRIQSDREAFAEAEQMLAAADSTASDAGRIVHVSQTDGIPDSSATHEYVNQIEACSQALKECRVVLTTEHSAWRELMLEINRQHTRLGEAMAGLKDELRRARQAVDSIRLARAEVNRAAMWSGSYGVRITGSPGANQVQMAHELLSQGQYSDASRTAAFACTKARQAIASAEAEEAAIRRRREAEARRRRRNASSSFSSSSSFGSSSSSFGSSSSSSGFSSSSFSSGSGFSRSGW